MTEVIYSISSKIIENTSTICVIAGGAAVLYFCNKMFINYMIKSKDNEILELNNTITEQQKEISSLGNNLNSIDNIIKNQEDKILELEDTITSQQKEISNLSNTNINNLSNDVINNINNISSRVTDNISIDNIADIIREITPVEMDVLLEQINTGITDKYNLTELIEHLKMHDVNDTLIHKICIHLNNIDSNIINEKKISIYDILRNNILSPKEPNMEKVRDFLTNQFSKKTDTTGSTMIDKVADLFISQLDTVFELINSESLPNFTFMLFLIYSLYFLGTIIIYKIMDSNIIRKYIKTNASLYLFNLLILMVNSLGFILLNELNLI